MSSKSKNSCFSFLITCDSPRIADTDSETYKNFPSFDKMNKNPSKHFKKKTLSKPKKNKKIIIS